MDGWRCVCVCVCVCIGAVATRLWRKSTVDLVFGVWGFIHSSSLVAGFFLLVSSNWSVPPTPVGREEGYEY